MESYYAGWLSILPPIIAIVFAVITKEVFSSLIIGIFTGTLIHSIGTNANMVLFNTLTSTAKIMVARLDFIIIMFCSALGALVYVIYLSGGTTAYGNKAVTLIRGRRSAMLSTAGLGACIFIDDYFNCITVGTVMKPVTDSLKISRAKLAYLIDSTAAPICIIAPVSSWAAAVSSNLKGTGVFDSDFSAFVSTIPFNYYALLALLLIFLVSFFGLDFGPMRRSEKNAQEDKVQSVVGVKEDKIICKNGNAWDMIIPLLVLIVVAVLSMLETGGYWGKNPAYHSFSAAFGNCTASVALVRAAFIAILAAFLLYVPRRLMTLSEFMEGIIEGVKTMIPANMVLVFAWAISGVCQDMLQTPKFVESVVSGMHIGAVLPAGIFLIAAALSFALGTAWGTFGILIPLIVPIAQAACPDLVVAALASTLAGSVFGDHCSPISDTTILSSASSGCSHIEHVSTQLPYCCLVALSCIVGYLLVGIFKLGALSGLVSAAAFMCICLFGLNRWYAYRESRESV